MSDLPPPDGPRPTDPTTAMPAAGLGQTPPQYSPTPGNTPPYGTAPQGPPAARPGGPPPRPSASGVSTGIVVTVAVLVAIIGFLAGALIFGGDDNGNGNDTTAPISADDTPVVDGAEDLTAQIATLTAERDQLAAQVSELTTQLESTDGDSAELSDRIEELQTDLDAVTAERDDLQAELDAIGEVVPVPDLVDGTADDARDAADEAGWELIERDADDVPDDAEPGTVLSQTPEPDTAMVEGSVLIIDVVPEPPES